MKNKYKKNYFQIITFFLILLLIVFFVLFLNQLSSQNTSEQLISLENTIRKDIVHCYAIEGKYPESIEYLKAHYGLTYNEEIFYVDYLPIGSNIMPDFTVLYKGN